MMENSGGLLKGVLLILMIFVTNWSTTQAKAHRHHHHHHHHRQCKPAGDMIGITPPAGQCNTENNSTCCVAGESYTTYKCSPRVRRRTKAILTLNSFEQGGDGGGPSECDGRFHSDDTLIVALSTGWYNRGSRCGRKIVIRGNGRTAKAKVVDECDSLHGCDPVHDYQPPCQNNIVDASKAVWAALGVSPNSPLYGQMHITWHDA